VKVVAMRRRVWNHENVNAKQCHVLVGSMAELRRGVLVLALGSVDLITRAATIGSHVPNQKNKFAMSVLTGGCAALNYPTCNCDLVHRAYKSLQESAGEWFVSDSRK
jgi:hypothetical protein